jgi:hypothetical protein
VPQGAGAAGVGFANVVTEIVACGRHGEIPTYGVRSNLIGGLPAAMGRSE